MLAPRDFRLRIKTNNYICNLEACLTNAALFHPAPLIMSETVYDCLEQMVKKQKKEQVPPAAKPQNKRPSTSKPPKKSNSSNAVAPPTHKNLEEAFKALDVWELKQHLAHSQTLFPDNPSIWVEDLAEYLNLNLSVPETEPTHCSCAHDYPYCFTGQELRDVIEGLIRSCSDVLPRFFDHCVYAMLTRLDRQSGEPLHGYRICIQAILKNQPTIATRNLPDYLELLRSVQNRPVKCLTIMWALGQAVLYDLSHGLRVWLGIMLPVLGVKSLSAYAIAYLDLLLLLHPNLRMGFGIMGPKEFFPLLDFAFMPKNALSSSLQGQLRRLYPRLKILAFGAKPKSTLHEYLPSFLSRATSHCPDAMKRELLRSMTKCLCVDKLSLEVWRELYSKHLHQSSLLLNHLLKSWKDLPPKLQKNLEVTIQSFQVSNEMLRDTYETPELHECIKLCQNLQVKMSGRGFPWSKLLMVLLFVNLAVILAHNVIPPGSFTDSSTAKYLHDSGVTAVFQQAWGKITVYSKQGFSFFFSWVATNTPYDYSERVLGPLITQAMEKSKAASIEWVYTNTPDTVFQVLLYVMELHHLLHLNYILPALAFLSLIYKGYVTCRQGHAVTFASSTWQLLQHWTSSIKTWAQELLTNLYTQ
ncbi:transmembrane protein 214 [Limanda limanda]|uniref:transmembrane protein 214 n=1 Tax=Limanda limanda TaxID=27771 RepID=UPI0029C745BE|nr:transmembrane protein 214 [Limanda limanda]